MVRKAAGALFWHGLLVVACAIPSADNTQDASIRSRDAGECVDVPPSLAAHVDHTLTADADAAGCRSFGPGGCDACCIPVASAEAKPDCLLLSERGESLKGDACEPGCTRCARCTLEDEANLRDGEQGCDCSIPRNSPGFNPAVPCERTCSYLEVAIRSCSYLVCRQ